MSFLLPSHGNNSLPFTPEAMNKVVINNNLLEALLDIYGINTVVALPFDAKTSISRPASPVMQNASSGPSLSDREVALETETCPQFLASKQPVQNDHSVSIDAPDDLDTSGDDHFVYVDQHVQEDADETTHNNEESSANNLAQSSLLDSYIFLIHHEDDAENGQD